MWDITGHKERKYSSFILSLFLSKTNYNSPFDSFTICRVFTKLFLFKLTCFNALKRHRHPRTCLHVKLNRSESLLSFNRRLQNTNTEGKTSTHNLQGENQQMINSSREVLNMILEHCSFLLLLLRLKKRNLWEVRNVNLQWWRNNPELLEQSAGLDYILQPLKRRCKTFLFFILFTFSPPYPEAAAALGRRTDERFARSTESQDLSRLLLDSSREWQLPGNKDCTTAWPTAFYVCSLQGQM